MLNIAFSKFTWDAETPDESSCFPLVEREDLLPFPPNYEVKPHIHSKHLPSKIN
jgi:hypothetical protein